MGIQSVTRQAAAPQRADPQRSASRPRLSRSDSAAPPLHRLQRAVGNRAINHLLRSHTIQPKLTVSHPGNVYEREADRVADQVMRMPEPQPGLDIQRSPLNIQRQCTKCEEELKRQSRPDEEEEVVQPKPADSAAASGVSGGVESYINTARGAGQPLPAVERAYFEPRFGREFGTVRVHTDNRAARAAAQIKARAFTSGDDIVFGARQFAPGTTEGRGLLAHELTHVIQQSKEPRVLLRYPGDLQRKIDGEHDLMSPRFAGDEELEAAFDNERHIKQGSSGPAVGKLQQALIDAGFLLPISTRKTGKPDEIFGPETRAGVAAFQKDAGLTGRDIDGIVGPITMGLFDVRFPPGPKPPGPKPVVPATRKTVTVNITRVHGSTKVVDRSLAFANTIYRHQANVEVLKGTEVVLNEAQSKAAIGDDLILEEHFFDKVLSDEEKRLFSINRSGGAVLGCFVKALTENNGLAIRPSMGVGFVGFAVGNPASDKTFAHELGHALGIELHTLDSTLLMAPGATGSRLSDEDIKTIRASSLVK